MKLMEGCTLANCIIKSWYKAKVIVRFYNMQIYPTSYLGIVSTLSDKSDLVSAAADDKPKSCTLANCMN